MDDDELKITSERERNVAIDAAAVQLAKRVATRQMDISADLRSKPAVVPKADPAPKRERGERGEAADLRRQKAVEAERQNTAQTGKKADTGAQGTGEDGDSQEGPKVDIEA